jgi:nicotinamidase-related amidase
MDIELTPSTTALILIDLQHGIVARQLAPHSSEDVLKNCATLAGCLRAQGGTVIYVHVLVNQVRQLPVDAPMPRGNTPLPPNSSDIVPESGIAPDDLIVTKRQWGAFYGTDLDQQLRRRNIRTIILGGIATNMGVESTARAAFDRAYELVFAEDAMSSISAEAHQFSIQNIFPRMGRVRSTDQLRKALE